MSDIPQKVASQVMERAAVGLAKYGTDMSRTDLSLKDWLQHLQEELLDAAVYVERLKQEIK